MDEKSGTTNLKSEFRIYESELRIEKSELRIKKSGLRSEAAIVAQRR